MKNRDGLLYELLALIGFLVFVLLICPAVIFAPTILWMATGKTIWFGLYPVMVAVAVLMMKMRKTRMDGE